MAQVSKKKLKKAQQVQNYRIQKFHEKVEHYSKFTLPELKEIYENEKPGGIYREALIEVVRRKQIEEANKTIKEQSESNVNVEEVINNSEQSEEPQQNNQ